MIWITFFMSRYRCLTYLAGSSLIDVRQFWTAGPNRP